MPRARTARIARRTAADIGLIAWSVSWFIIAQRIRRLVLGFVDSAQLAYDATAQVNRYLGSASEALSEIPLIGGQVSSQVNNLSATTDGFSTALLDYIQLIERSALFLGVGLFLLPVILYLAFWFPRRLAGIREARAIKQIQQGPNSDNLLALRALATAPLSQLTEISANPMADWQNGNPAVIQSLAELERAKFG